VVQYGKASATAVHANNIHINQGDFCFDLMINDTQIAPFRCGLPGHHNVQNAVAALGICIEFLQLPIHQLQNGIASFKGAKRRFEYIHKSDRFVVIDDYAHHPEELNAIIGSVKTLYPNKTITGIFQPHLFSRTQDFADGFAQSLSELDQIYLLNIYPAREQPIPGVNSDWLLSLINHPKKEVITPDQVLEKIKNNPAEVLLILGAGDIDRIVQPLAKIYDELEARTQ
jgi:UDP-N-acetylmuramate--alanine ligase